MNKINRGVNCRLIYGLPMQPVNTLKLSDESSASITATSGPMHHGGVGLNTELGRLRVSWIGCYQFQYSLPSLSAHDQFTPTLAWS